MREKGAMLVLWESDPLKRMRLAFEVADRAFEEAKVLRIAQVLTPKINRIFSLLVGLIL